MRKKLALIYLLISTISLPVYGQLSLVFPKNDYVFDSNNILFEWNLFPNASDYQIQVSTVDDFSSLLIDQNNLIMASYSSSSLPVNQKYFWRCKANNSSWSAVRTFRILEPSGLSQMEMWLKADSVQTVSGNRVTRWYDLSGNSHDYLQTNSTNQPYLLSNVTEVNNHNMIEFRAVENNYFSPIDLSFLSEGEVFSILKLKNAPLSQASKSGLWTFGSSSLSDHYPYVDNNIYMGFGRDTRLIVGNILNDVNLEKAHILNINSSASFDFRVNELELFSSTNGTSAFNSNVYLGQSLSGHYMDGSMGELLLFNSELSDSLRELVHMYLYHKYAPPVNLGQNIVHYGFCDTILYADKHFDSYLWSDGSIADSLVVSESGTYSVEVVDVFGFTSSDTIEVIFPEPNYPQNQLFCPGDSTTWYTNLGPNYNYLWSDGSTADSLSINTPGDYHVQITDTNGCVFQSDTLYFDADPFETIVDLGPDANLCTGNSIGLVAGDVEAVGYLWSTGDTDSAIIVNTTGTYYIDVVNNNGCEASDTIEITIIGDAPNVLPGISSVVCQNEQITYQDQSTTTDGSTVISWNWDFGDGGSATDEQGNYVYNNNGSFSVSLTVGTSAGCFNDTNVSVSVNEQPSLDFVTVNDCQETVINFNGGQLTPTTITTWEWNFDDPSSGVDNEGSGQNTTHIFDTSGVYDVELIGTDINGCKDTIVQAVTIEAAPQVDFSFVEVCEGSLIEFDNLSTIDTSSSISGYNWSFGDGTFSGQAEPQKLYSNYGTYSVSLNVTGNNGCTGQLTQPLKIHAFPIVDQDINASCAGIASTFVDSSFVPNGSLAEVYWSLNGANSLNGFTVEEVFENSGVQSVEQTVVSSFGCSSTESYTVQVNDFISADFEIEPSALLAGYPTSFINQSIGALTYEWIFDNLGTSTDLNPDFTFPESTVGQDMTIELKIENSFSCRDSVSLTLPVLAPRTDLAVTQLFVQEDNGFYIVGVELENKGTTPITSSDLFLRTPSTDVIKETWEGELKAGEKEIYIFSASPSMTVPQGQTDQNYVCVEAQIKTPVEFKDEDLSNNDACEAISESSSVLIVPHPNPVENDLNIQLVLPFDEEGTLKIYNAQGQTVAVVKEEASFKKGLNSYKVNTELWQSGNYSIVYNGESEQQIAKVVKL